jgi:flagellar hook protein FlgE
MFTSFSAALTGLAASEVGVDVVGNNLANLNTTGYKASSVSFYDLVAQSLGLGTGESVGLGTGKPLTVHEFTQGAIQTTSGALDGAIQGDGFFVVRDPNGTQSYTRAGNFQVDANGNLVTATGERVQGWNIAGGVLNTNGDIADISIPSGTLRPPVATSNMSLDINLDASATVGQPNGSFSTPIQIVDSLGTTHVLTVSFTKSGANAWDYQVTIPGADVTAGTAGTPFPIPGASGTLTFDSNGVLTDPPAPPPSTNGLVPVAIAGFADGAADLNANWSLYSPDLAGRITQFAQASSISSNAQDGLAAAQLTHVTLGNSGQVIAQFSNGQQVTVAQVALASIRNPASLVAAGNNNFQIGPETAAPAIGVPNTGGRGQVLGGALESSTVDIAREFTNLIVMQRGYEANAKVISATDQLTQVTINLKQG